MKNDNTKTICVYENWSAEQPILLGFLYIDLIRGSELYSFEYDKKWLSNAEQRFLLDPELSLFEGRQYPIDKKMFGIFSDSCPDRWGRTLLKRKEVILARSEGRKPNTLTETDYLLGINDITRMGALRFRADENGPFLADDTENAVPPWVALRDLEYASFAYENEEDDPGGKWLKQILSPGSSLGGARPKASVQSPDGTLWIAKFPSKHDEYDIGAWEMVAHDLASRCGLSVPNADMKTFSKHGSTFLSQRFDRIGSRRIHFASAMTLLGKTDGMAASEGVSYLDLAEFIRANGAEPKKDLEELWRRIVFNMAVSNTDDHLRNHGFLLTANGWRLSPMYDVNPVPEGDALALNVTDTDNSISFDLAIETASFYGLSKDKGSRIIKQIVSLVKENAEAIALHYGIKRSEFDRIRLAFDL